MAIIKLYDSGGNEVKIDDSKEISRGGEGRIIQLDKNHVVKLYLPGIQPITDQKFAELHALQPAEFIKPLRILKDKKGVVNGFVMKIVSSDNYPLYSAYNLNFCDQHKLTLQYKHKVIDKLIDSVNHVHSKNIIIGDLNPFNILINDTAKVNFIDVDSYQTPGTKHSGRLLDDIRDYLFNGEITTNSDYFALAVMAFNFLTNVHPFKGVHKVYGGLNERMIHRIPIFDKDPNLIVPKCYKPIQDQNLQNQFMRIFKLGERFLINLHSGQQIIIPVQPVQTKKHSMKDIMVHDILLNTAIKKILTTDKKMVIITSDDIAYLYDVSQKGYATCKNHYTLQPSDQLYLINSNTFILRNNSLYILDTDNLNLNKLEGFYSNEYILHTHQYEDVLAIVTENNLYTIYLNNIIQNKYIKFDVTPVHGLSFKSTTGLIQNVGGQTFIRYNYKGTLNKIMFPKYLQDIYQIGDIGIAQYIENKKIVNKLFKINGLKIELGQEEFRHLTQLGYNPNIFIAMPEDDKLKILRFVDFANIAEITCDLVDDMSQIHHTNAGLIIKTEKNIYLINRRT